MPENLSIHQRHFLKGKEIRKLKADLIEHFGENNISALIKPKSKIEWIKLENREELIAIDKMLCFWYREEQYIPLLSILIDPNINFEMKYVEVDEGAVPYVVNKADVMRPGITYIDSSIDVGDIVKICDQKNKRALAVGQAMYNAVEMESKKKGKVIKNLHTINDPIWNFIKNFN